MTASPAAAVLAALLLSAAASAQTPPPETAAAQSAPAQPASAQPAPQPERQPERRPRSFGPRGPVVVSPEVKPDRQVTFRLHAPKAEAVQLSSSDLPGGWSGSRLSRRALMSVFGLT